jgi:hypothetical protein
VGWPYRLAVFGHLMALMLGFGAVLVLDVYGFRRIRNKDAPVISVVHLAHVLDIGIWLGLIGLLVTGAFLHPNVHSHWFQIKAAAVLLVALNGVSVQALNHRVYELPPTTVMRDLPTNLMRRLMLAAAISGLAWWTAIGIGFFSNIEKTAGTGPMYMPPVKPTPTQTLYVTSTQTMSPTPVPSSPSVVPSVLPRATVRVTAVATLHATQTVRATRTVLATVTVIPSIVTVPGPTVTAPGPTVTVTAPPAS